MNEMEPHEEKIDHLLRSALGAPVPALPENFDQRVGRSLTRDSQSLDRSGRMLLWGYGLVSLLVSGVIMRAQGLRWEFVVVVNLATIASLAVGWSIWRATRKTARHGAA